MDGVLAVQRWWVPCQGRVGWLICTWVCAGKVGELHGCQILAHLFPELVWKDGRHTARIGKSTLITMPFVLCTSDTLFHNDKANYALK
jgi:hypothetical protein